jgi:hypothetical protein
LIIDATKEEGDTCVDTVSPLLAQGCVLVTVNTMAYTQGLASFFKRQRLLPGFSRYHVVVGDGFEPTVRVKNP